MTLTLLLIGIGCESTEMIEGKVVDVWGNPIEGATVMVVGGNERPMTDADGRYRFARTDGTLVMKAGCKGYIQEHREVEVVAGQKAEGPVFELYPKPDTAGFYVVGSGSYQKLDPQRVQSVGNALQQFRGIADHGSLSLETARPRIVYHTDLREDEIMRLELELHELQYEDTASLPGPMGNTDVAVKMWVDKDQKPLDIVPLRSNTDYLITPKEDLTPGAYALETQGLLSGPADAYAQIPAELRLVFPFEIR